MSYTYSTIVRKKYSHMTYEMRRTMEKLLIENDKAPKAKKKTNKEIYESLGISKATFYRERKRGLVDVVRSDLEPYKMYSADVAQDDYDFEATRKGPNPKIGNNHKAANFIEDLIANESYSPYAASIALRNEESLGLTLSFKTIYNYIERGFFASLTKEDLPRKGKSSRRQYKGVRRTKRDPLAKSIRDRPEAANNRSELGHWEMDCMESGKKHRSTLLTMVDRRSRRTILLKLSSQTQSAVIKALDDLENSLGPEKFKMTFKTITVDNGSEFLNWKDMEVSFFDKDEKRCRIYFCDAYSAYQRGTNEQINGQIRRHIPKGSIIRDYSKAQIKSIEEWINNYPRGIHAGHSALDVWLAEAA